MDTQGLRFVGLLLLWLFSAVLVLLTIRVFQVQARSVVVLVLAGLALGIGLTYYLGPPALTAMRDARFYGVALPIASAFNGLMALAMRWTHGDRRRTGGGAVTLLAVLSLAKDAYMLMRGFSGHL